jgi:hypothetical protein
MWAVFKKKACFLWKKIIRIVLKKVKDTQLVVYRVILIINRNFFKSIIILQVVCVTFNLKNIAWFKIVLMIVCSCNLKIICLLIKNLHHYLKKNTIIMLIIINIIQIIKKMVIFFRLIIINKKKFRIIDFRIYSILKFFFFFFKLNIMYYKCCNLKYFSNSLIFFCIYFNLFIFSKLKSHNIIYILHKAIDFN